MIQEMIKIDLISGILGSGKTTFIRRYAKYLKDMGEKICILENDYGAINIDSLLLDDLREYGVDIQMIQGGNDLDCHARRFKTKLITMSMLKYDRVIVEPSGIFDVDEFFDLLSEDELANKYEIDNVITLVKGDIDSSISENYKYMLASQISIAGKILVTYTDKLKDISKLLDFLNESLLSISSNRLLKMENLLVKGIKDLDSIDFDNLKNSGYRQSSFLKKYSLDDKPFESIFYMNLDQSKDEIIKAINLIFKDTTIGEIHRIKGFVKENNEWYEINSTKDKTDVKKINNGQSIIIIIGERLYNEKVNAYFKSEFSSDKTR